MIIGTELKAQPIDLSFYTDANGLIDVQKLTCDQLRNTYQGDADALTTWYIGWYNGLAKTHYLDFRKGRLAEHEIIEYCEANPDKLVVEAITVIFRDDRARRGVEMK
jgi:hypothetical protein